MKYKGVLLVCVVVLGLITVFRISSAARTEAGPAAQQSVIRLEQRMYQLEQRLFSMENNLRNIEQQSRMAGAGRGVVPEDVARLRLEVQALTNRLAEHECALGKLDERTLSPARRKSAGRNDPCRQNADAPIQLR
jgi:hypothetical protein